MRSTSSVGSPFSVLAEDAAVTGGIGRLGGEDRHRRLVGDVKVAHPLDRLGTDQRHVSRQHQHMREALQRFASYHQRVSGSALLALQHEVDAGGLQRLTHQFGLVPDDGEDVLRRNDLAGRGDHVGQQRLAGDLVQHLGMPRLQARAFSGGENRNGELELVLVGWAERSRTSGSS